MDLKIIGEIFNKIQEERIKQNAKWGEQNHSLVNWVALLNQEVGEVKKEAVDWVNKNPVKSKQGGCIDAADDVQQHRLERYEKEIIQTAAVCVEMLESLYRNEKNPSKTRICTGGEEVYFRGTIFIVYCYNERKNQTVLIGKKRPNDVVFEDGPIYTNDDIQQTFK